MVLKMTELSEEDVLCTSDYKEIKILIWPQNKVCRFASHKNLIINSRKHISKAYFL